MSLPNNPFTASEDNNIWIKARAGQYTLLMTSLVSTVLSIVNIFRDEWSIYLSLVLEMFLVGSLYGPAVGFVALT